MKKDIHPKYYDNAKITCSCGEALNVGSTQKNIEIEICSRCHPLYTGTKKTVDTTGRVDRFKKLAEKAAQKKEAAEKAAETKKKKAKTAKKVKTKTKKTTPKKVKEI